MLNFDEIKQNALDQGVALSEIAICYENLDETEIAVLENLGLVAQRVGPNAIGKFSDSGEALFPNKAVSVLMIGAA